MKRAILIPTFKRYRPLAELTRMKIQQLWSDAPKIYLSGVSTEGEPGWVPQSGKEGSWGVDLLYSVQWLVNEGFEQLYLILDDHPPVRLCGEIYLNETLPYFMEQSDATYIGLLGWGQGQGSMGTCLGDGHQGIEKTAGDYQYKFSLHPGLWHAPRLQKILEVMLDEFPNEPTPWKFEKFSGSLKSLEALYLDKCYRIDGLSSSPRKWFSRTIRRQRILTKSRQGQLNTFGGAVRAYYEGPYPMIWSGVMHRGELNPAYLKYLNLFGQQSYVRELKNCLRDICGVDLR
ncbi:MAG: hypothetical protein AAF649_03085 [Verrucomicrobiota bacterium]